MIALSGKADESRSEQITNINEVYEKLLCDVWERVWGDVPEASHNMDEEIKLQHRQKGPVGFFTDQTDFERVLEYVSVAAWRSGESRTASFSEFSIAIEGTEIEDIWHEFQQSFDANDDNENFATLALTFFFKENDGEDQGFEFTHRSFGEYLTARCLWRFWFENSIKTSKIRRIEELSEWIRLASYSPITVEIAEYLKREFLRNGIEDLRHMRKALAHCFKLVLRDGFSLHFGDKETWRLVEQRQMNAEGAMLACLSACSAALLSISNEDDPVCVGFKDGKVGRACINRIGITNEVGPSNDLTLESRISVYRTFLAGLVFSTCDSLTHRSSSHGRCDYDMMRLFHGDLSYSDFQCANMRAVGLSNATLHKTNFEGAKLSHCVAIGADFSTCKLDGVEFIDSQLQNTNFSNMILSDVNFDDADLEDANFSGSILADVSMRDADLTDTIFWGTDLSKTKGLKKSQLNKAKGDDRTLLPKGIEPPKKWLASREQDT